MSKAAPHRCPRCGSAAYLGFTDLQCTNAACPNYDIDTTLMHWLEVEQEHNDNLDDLSEDERPTWPPGVGGD